MHADTNAERERERERQTETDTATKQTSETERQVQKPRPFPSSGGPQSCHARHFLLEFAQVRRRFRQLRPGSRARKADSSRPTIQFYGSAQGAAEGAAVKPAGVSLDRPAQRTPERRCRS